MHTTPFPDFAFSLLGRPCQSADRADPTQLSAYLPKCSVSARRDCISGLFRSQLRSTVAHAVLPRLTGSLCNDDRNAGTASRIGYVSHQGNALHCAKRILPQKVHRRWITGRSRHGETKFCKFSATPMPRQGLLFVGRLSVEKGVKTLASAAVLLSEVDLRVAGEGPEASELRRVEGIRLLGHLSPSDVRHEMSCATAFVMPSILRPLAWLFWKLLPLEPRLLQVVSSHLPNL